MIHGIFTPTAFHAKAMGRGAVAHPGYGLLIVATIILISRISDAASPQLSYVYPPGVQRGHEHTITFAGARLKDAEEILFYDAGVKVKKLEAVDPQNVCVTVEV